MRGDKKTGKRRGRILRNNLFAVRWLLRIAPGYTAYLMITAVFNELLILFEHTFLVAYLVGCIEEQRPLSDAMTVLILFVVFGILYNIGQNFVDGYAAPKANAKIRKEIHLTLYGKAVDIEISRYDNSEFYNDFVWAMQKAPEHITGALSTFNSLAEHVHRETPYVFRDREPYERWGERSSRKR